MKNGTTKEEQEMQLTVADTENKLAEILNRKPVSSMIKRNTHANDSEYVEIGYVEMKLDQIYGSPNWSWVVDSWDIKLNAICVSGHLMLMFKDKVIKRGGVGAIEIQLKKGSNNVFNGDNLASKAMEKNFPAAEARAFKNAAKSLGNIFGRCLNRNFQHEFRADDEATELRLKNTLG